MSKSYSERVIPVSSIYAISYPLDLPNVKVVDMNEIVLAAVEGKFGVLDSDSEGQMVDVESGLLCHESYLGFE